MADDNEFDLDAGMAESAKLIKAIDAGESADVDQLYSLFKTQHYVILRLMAWVAETAQESAKQARRDVEDLDRLGEVRDTVWRFMDVAIKNGVISEEDAVHILDVDDPIKVIERYLAAQAEEDNGTD